MLEGDSLGIAREALVDVSAAIAARDEEQLRRALTLARRFADAASVDEVLLQAHLFVGFPIVVEAFVRWRGIAPLATIADEDAGVQESWASRGTAVCRAVYGARYEQLRVNVNALHPSLERWMVEHGYGRVIGRSALDLATRELCIVALLAVWDAPRQLRSHLHGALNAGATRLEVEAALDVAWRYMRPGSFDRARAVWETMNGPDRSISAAEAMGQAHAGGK